MSNVDLLRLSRFVVFVDYTDHVEVQHAARGQIHRVERSVYLQLREFGCFRPWESALEQWVEAGVLVRPFTDTLARHGPAPGSEAALAAEYHRWYWRHEVETEREYRWFGQVVVKMPTDLFYYQELLTRSSRRRVLELGRGRGGGVWFFASVLQLLGGGLIVSLDVDPQRLIDRAPWDRVDIREIAGDALSDEGVEVVSLISSAYDLVVLDLGGDPSRNLAALRRWSGLVARGGTMVIEDLWQGDEAAVVREVDEFLLARPEFSLCERGSAFPLLKGLGLRRTGLELQERG